MQHLRAARTKHGRFSPAGRLLEQDKRRWLWNSYRSLRALERAGGRWKDGGLNPWAQLAREARDGIDKRILDEWRREAEQAQADADYKRLREKGLVPADPEVDARLAVAMAERQPVSPKAAAVRDARESREALRRFRAALRAVGL